ncbi:MAG TPA: hypothetical protein VIX80_03080 [Candidatus Kapabacteria bacterium]
MTETQNYALILYSMNLISANTPYWTAQLFMIYLQNKPSVDLIYNDVPTRNQIIQKNIAHLGPLSPDQIVIMDPGNEWGGT